MCINMVPWTLLSCLDASFNMNEDVHLHPRSTSCYTWLPLPILITMLWFLSYWKAWRLGKDVIPMAYIRSPCRYTEVLFAVRKKQAKYGWKLKTLAIHGTWREPKSDRLRHGMWATIWDLKIFKCREDWLDEQRGWLQLADNTSEKGGSAKEVQISDVDLFF